MNRASPGAGRSGVSAMSGWESEPLGSLSNREHQVADLICSGLPNKLIANQLGLSEGTVKQHVHNTFVKLGTRTRCQLIQLMIQPVSPSNQNRA
jgi:DNA-binding NarL/FixJ family response regulator